MRMKKPVFRGFCLLLCGIMLVCVLPIMTVAGDGHVVEAYPDRPAVTIKPYEGEPEPGTVFCELEEHIHTEDCRLRQENGGVWLFCQEVEHTHKDYCYAKPQAVITLALYDVDNGLTGMRYNAPELTGVTEEGEWSSTREDVFFIGMDWNDNTPDDEIIANYKGRSLMLFQDKSTKNYTTWIVETFNNSDIHLDFYPAADIDPRGFAPPVDNYYDTIRQCGEYIYWHNYMTPTYQESQFELLGEGPDENRVLSGPDLFPLTYQTPDMDTYGTELAFCADVYRGMQFAGALYRRMNLEDAKGSVIFPNTRYTEKEMAARMRSVMMNAYPFISYEESLRRLEKSGLDFVVPLDQGQLLGAAQAAIWEAQCDTGEFHLYISRYFYYNPSARPTDPYSIAGLHSGKYYNIYQNIPEPVWFTNVERRDILDINVQILKHYLQGMDPVYTDPDNFICRDFDYTANCVRSADGENLDLTVDITLQRALSHADIVLTAGNRTAKLEDASGSKFTLRLEGITPNAEVTINIFGYQHTNRDVYFYEAVPEVYEWPEGYEPTPDDLAKVPPGFEIDMENRTTTSRSQSFIGFGEGETPVQMEKSFRASVGSITLEVSKEITGASTPEDKTFSFDLELTGDHEEGSVIYPASGTVTGAGDVVFDSDIVFNKSGVYVFKLTERDDQYEHYIFDGSVYTITCTVEEDHGLTVVTEITITKDGEPFTGNMTFVNSYDPPTDVPNTGDSTHLGLLLTVTAIAVLSLAVLKIRKRGNARG